MHAHWHTARQPFAASNTDWCCCCCCCHKDDSSRTWQPTLCNAQNQRAAATPPFNRPAPCFALSCRNAGSLQCPRRSRHDQKQETDTAAVSSKSMAVCCKRYICAAFEPSAARAANAARARAAQQSCKSSTIQQLAAKKVSKSTSSALGRINHRCERALSSAGSCRQPSNTALHLQPTLHAMTSCTACHKGSRHRLCSALQRPHICCSWPCTAASTACRSCRAWREACTAAMPAVVCCC